MPAALRRSGLTPALGTPDYISPEQVMGQRGDQRSDVYALGAMLYEMLTGQPPFTGPSPLAVMNERLLTDPAPARELNPEIPPRTRRDSFPSAGARPPPSLRNSIRDGLGAGAPGTRGDRKRLAWAGSAGPASNQRTQARALRGIGVCALGVVRCDVADGSALN